MNFLKKSLLTSFLFISSIGYAEHEAVSEIVITINLTCPASEQLEAFKESIPEFTSTSASPTVNYEEFQKSITKNMTQLIRLVESGKVYNSNWSVKVESKVEAKVESNAPSHKTQRE